jgi:hypothetical protein
MFSLVEITTLEILNLVKGFLGVELIVRHTNMYIITQNLLQTCQKAPELRHSHHTKTRVD